MGEEALLNTGELELENAEILVVRVRLFLIRLPLL